MLAEPVKLDELSTEQLRLHLVRLRKKKIELVNQEIDRRQTIEAEKAEWLKCANGAEGCIYFINKYVHIYDSEAKDWIPFKLWEEQEQCVRDILANKEVIILKARQLGLTWLCLAIALWKVLFQPIQLILLFSLRDIEARELLSENRFKGMFKRLPLWMKPATLTDEKKEFVLANGSSIKAFPTTAGDSYTATFAIVDEADLVPKLNDLLQSAKPTIDAGGQIVLLSRSNKDRDWET